MVLNGLLLMAMLTAGLLAYVRLAPSDAVALHVDPTTVTEPDTRNFWRVADGADAPTVVVPRAPDQVAGQLSAIATTTPRTRLLAGGGLHTTWVTRSLLMGFPDYTTVMITPAGTGSQVTIFARARFGQSDMGVNRARVKHWLTQLGTAP